MTDGSTQVEWGGHTASHCPPRSVLLLSLAIHGPPLSLAGVFERHTYQATIERMSKFVGKSPVFYT